MCLVCRSSNPISEVLQNVILREYPDCTFQLQDGLWHPVRHLILQFDEVNVHFRGLFRSVDHNIAHTDILTKIVFNNYVVVYRDKLHQNI